MIKESSETTREAFCFNLYFTYKPQHKKKLQRSFLEWFIGFSEGDCTFHTWVDKKKKRAGFTIDQQDPKVLYCIKQQLGFGRVLPYKNGWRFQIWDTDGLIRLFCLFYGNLVLDKRHLKFQKWMTFIRFPNDFFISEISLKHFEKNMVSGTRFISLDNAWLSGFWQAAGGFYVYGGGEIRNPRLDSWSRIILRMYVTQRAEKSTLNQIAITISGKNKNISTLCNGKTGTRYNRLDFASQACLIEFFSYFEKFSLVGEKHRTFLRCKRIWEIREKIKNNDFPVTEKSIKKLKRLIAATKKTK